jgi:Ras-related protein Rab-7A
MVDEKPLVLQIWDTAGQERFNSISEIFHRGANICFLVFDVTNSESFEALEQWHDEFVSNALRDGSEEFPFACIGNKLDKASERSVTEKRARNWVTSKPGMTYYETSAKDATNVAQAFTETARRAFKSMAATASYKADTDSNIVLNPKQSETKSGCCK